MGGFWVTYQIYNWFKRSKLIRKGVKVSGYCSDLRYYDDEAAAGNLVVEYEDKNGNKYELISNTGSITHDKYLNKFIDVYYDENDPKTACLKIEIKFVSIISLLFYTVILLAGLFLTVGYFAK